MKRPVLFATLLAALLLLPGCGTICKIAPDLCEPTPPPPPPPCSPVPDAPESIVWKNNNTRLELTYQDMPVTVGGGDEACVMRRRLVVDLGAVRKVTAVSSFHGFDNGDAVESLTVLYAKDGFNLYQRSEHLESVDPDCYDAFDPPEAKDYDTDGLILDFVHRTTGLNAAGNLSSRSHLVVFVDFAKADCRTLGCPPGYSCKKATAGPNPQYVCVKDPTPECEDVEADLVACCDPPQEFRDEIKEATTALGDLSGNPPQENLKKLAAKLMELNEGLCAFGGIEAVFIKRSDGLWEENHAVYFGDGGWTGNGYGKYKGSHYEGDPPPPPDECGIPDPLGLSAEFVLKHHNNWWDSTFRICNRDFCDAACDSFIGRRCCPVRCEGDPEREPCEKRVIGTQKWWCDGTPITGYCGTVSAPCLKPDNPAQAKCFGHVKTCTEDGATCAEADW